MPKSGGRLKVRDAIVSIAGPEKKWRRIWIFLSDHGARTRVYSVGQLFGGPLGGYWRVKDGR